MELQITNNTPQMPNTPTKTFISGLAKGGLMLFMFGPWKKGLQIVDTPKNNPGPWFWDSSGTNLAPVGTSLIPKSDLLTHQNPHERTKEKFSGQLSSKCPINSQDLNQPTPPPKKKVGSVNPNSPAFSLSLQKPFRQKPTKIRHGDTGGRGEIRHFDEILNQGSHQKSKKCHEDTHQNTCLFVFCCFFWRKWKRRVVNI